MTVTGCNGDRVVIEMPSGSLLVLDYIGGGDADRVMLHSLDSGDGDSPLNLDLVVLDPDSVHSRCHGEDAVSEVHRLYVRHHGPADGSQALVPADFIGDEELPEG